MYWVKLCIQEWHMLGTVLGRGVAICLDDTGVLSTGEYTKVG